MVGGFIGKRGEGMVPLKLSKGWAAFLRKADRDATAAIRKQAFLEAAKALRKEKWHDAALILDRMAESEEKA